MFTIKLKSFLNLSEKIIVRHLRNRRQIDSYGPNPGLNQRVAAFQKQGIKIEDEDAEEFIEESSSTFYNVGESYKEHLNETLKGKNDLQSKIVKEKYFKENMPNLLTWSEKEQIRHLATMYPDEWTPERIAESFPVTAHIAKMLLKYPWKPATEERIARHDASALRNWRELKDGTLNIADELRERFLKFSQRKIPPLNKKSIKVDLTQDEKIGEFEKIVRRCSNEDNIEKNVKYFSKTELRDNTDDINNKNVSKDRKRMTLDDLTAGIKKRIDGGSEVEITDRIIIDSVNKEVCVNSKTVELEKDISQEKELKSYEVNNEKVISVIDYPDRIRIPKKVYKKGATYKLKDCFYDHDGKFLYRILGLSE